MYERTGLRNSRLLKLHIDWLRGTAWLASSGPVYVCSIDAAEYGMGYQRGRPRKLSLGRKRESMRSSWAMARWQLEMKEELDNGDASKTLVGRK